MRKMFKIQNYEDETLIKTGKIMETNKNQQVADAASDVAINSAKLSAAAAKVAANAK